MVVSVKLPDLVGDDHDQFENFGDGSDHTRALVELKSKFVNRRNISIIIKFKATVYQGSREAAVRREGRW